MKILLIDALHPDEWLAGEYFQSFQADPIPNLDCIIGNPRAWQQPLTATGRHPRFIDANLNLVFPGDPNGNYEQRRAHELAELATRYDLVLDIHGCEVVGGDCSVMGASANALVQGVANRLGLTNVWVTDDRQFGSYASNYLGIELSPGTMMTAESLRQIIAELMNGPAPAPGRLTHYRFIDSVPAAAAAAQGLARHYDSFEPLPDAAMRALGFEPPVVAYGWDADIYERRTGFWGEVLKPEA